MGQQRRELGALEETVRGLAAAVRALSLAQHHPAPDGPDPARDSDSDDDIVRPPSPARGPRDPRRDLVPRARRRGLVPRRNPP
jgi:hypothetical protein